MELRSIWSGLSSKLNCTAPIKLYVAYRWLTEEMSPQQREHGHGPLMSLTLAPHVPNERCSRRATKRSSLAILCVALAANVRLISPRALVIPRPIKRCTAPTDLCSRPSI